jgi:hypothetical protein
MFDIQLPTKISILTLDYNNFSNEGVANLMLGLERNKTLTYLSLSYCGIDEIGIKFAKGFLESPECGLKKLILQGNPLKNAGLNELANMLAINPSVDELNASNIQFGGDQETTSNLATLLVTNNCLLAYNLKFNFITEKGNFINNLIDFDIFLPALKEAKSVWMFSIDENLSKEKFDEYLKTMKGRSRPKDKKKKKGK